VPGAVFAGDDWNWPEVEAGVRRHFTGQQISVQFNQLWWVTL
jgi:hypothetical protein